MSATFIKADPITDRPRQHSKCITLWYKIKDKLCAQIA